MPGEAIVRMMREMAQDVGYPQTMRTDLVWGKLTSVDPPELVLEGSGLVIPEQFIILSPFCYEKRMAVEVPKHGTSTAGKHAHSHNVPKIQITEILVWAGLEGGERVLCLKVHDGNLYLVLWRAEPEDGESNPYLIPENGIGK